MYRSLDLWLKVITSPSFALFVFPHKEKSKQQHVSLSDEDAVEHHRRHLSACSSLSKVASPHYSQLFPLCTGLHLLPLQTGIQLMREHAISVFCYTRTIMVPLAGRDRLYMLTGYAESGETATDLDIADLQVSEENPRYLLHV